MAPIRRQARNGAGRIAFSQPRHEAGLEAKGADARRWGGALQTIEPQAFGSAVLALLALGLVAFDLFAMAEAVFRRIRADRVV